MQEQDKTRILIFIGCLSAGGKERRLVELLTYLKNKDRYQFIVVVTKDEVHYSAFHDLNLPYYVLPKRWEKNDVTVFYQFYKICKAFKPHLIHTWGQMQTLYAIPVVLRQNIPLVNGQITSAPPRINKWAFSRVIDKINFKFSKVVLSNSKAGLLSFNPPINKRKVIYNGINMSRFDNLPETESIKSKYGITTPYTVVMSASFSPTKDYNLFYKVADRVTRSNNDITFIGVGQIHDDFKFQQLLALTKDNPRIKLPGRINDVEALVNACTLGVLFSVNGEGISNSIMEYMALSKPVIANAEGGTIELVHHNVNGYLIKDHTVEEISDMIIELINDDQKCKRFGEASRKIIDESFSLDRMGKAYEGIYNEVLNNQPEEAPILVQ